MKIAILGTGKMGSAVGQRLAATGHQVVYGSRRPDETRGRFAGLAGVSVTSYAEAARAAGLVIVAVPWVFALDLVKAIDRELAGKIIIDLTNPLSADVSHLVVGGNDSAAEQIARALPGAQVVKAFNGITADNFPNPAFAGATAQVLYCGDDAPAKAAVRELIQACGYEPQDCGALSNARYLEAIAMLWLQLAFWEDWGSDFAFRVARKQPPS